jgi:EmrB/QacA subfamily drug resistance transporter
VSRAALARRALLLEEPTRRRRVLILCICSLSLFMNYVDGTIVTVALPAVQRDLRASVSGLQWTVDGYFVALTALLILAGSLADRFGRRRVFLIGLTTFSFGSLLCSIAPNIGTLVFFRVLQAIGGSMLVPTTLSILRNTFTDPAERARAIGVWSGIFGLALASGPLVGGCLVDGIGWRSIFFVNVPIGIGGGVLAARYVPESRATMPRGIDPLGQLLLAVTLVVLTYAIIEAPSNGWNSSRSLGLFAVAVVGFFVFVTFERRRSQPLLEVHFFASPTFSGSNAIATLCFVVLGGLLFLSTLYLQDVRGDSALIAGVSLLPVTALIALTAPLTGRYVARRGLRVPLVVSGCCTLAGALLLATVAPSTSYLELALAYALLGIGFGSVNPTITNASLSGMPADQAGVASAVTSSARQLGNLLGVALLGAIATSGFHSQLTAAATLPQLSRPERLSLANSSIGTFAHLLPRDPNRAHAVTLVVREAFTRATHPAWLVAAGCAAAWTVIALGVTTRRAQRASARAFE